MHAPPTSLAKQTRQKYYSLPIWTPPGATLERSNCSMPLHWLVSPIPQPAEQDKHLLVSLYHDPRTLPSKSPIAEQSVAPLVPLPALNPTDHLLKFLADLTNKPRPLHKGGPAPPDEVSITVRPNKNPSNLLPKPVVQLDKPDKLTDNQKDDEAPPVNAPPSESPVHGQIPATLHAPQETHTKQHHLILWKQSWQNQNS